MKCAAFIAIQAALKVAKIAFPLSRKCLKHLFGKGHIISGHFIHGGRMAAGKAKCSVVISAEKRLKMRQGVAFAKYAPHAPAVILAAEIKLMLLEFGKLIDKGLVDNKALIAIGSRRFVLLRAYACLQKLGHLQMRIAQERRHACHRSHHLRQKRSATIANEQIGLLGIDDAANAGKRLAGMQRQVRRQHLSPTGKRLTQRPRHSTTARSKKSV